MSKATSPNVLADPEIQLHTQRILALQKEERQTREQLGRIVAEIGAELIAVKGALDQTTDKSAWLRWLKDHVHYSIRTAQDYMSVARFAKKTQTFAFFSGMDPSVLYRLAALPDEIAAILRPVEMACLGDARHQEETHAMRTGKRPTGRRNSMPLPGVSWEEGVAIC